jgi:hypothetical protein
MAAAASTIETIVGSSFVTSDGKAVSLADAIPESVKLVLILHTASW